MKYELQTLPKDYKSLFRLAEAQGWKHTRTEKDHHKFVSPDGRQTVITSGTPSDIRALDNFRAQMKRAGLRPYLPLKEDKPLSEPKLVVSKVAGDSSAPIVVSAPAAMGTATKKRKVIPAVKENLKKTILEILRESPSGLTTREIFLETQKRIPEMTDAHSISSSLHYYASKGIVLRAGYGFYKTAEKATAAPTEEEDDIKVLEDALMVLARLEVVVKRLKAKMQQINAAKAAFEAIK